MRRQTSLCCLIASLLLAMPGAASAHLLNEALSWHQRYVETGSMRAPANPANPG